MTAEALKMELGRSLRLTWPEERERPFPRYWAAVEEWLAFHAPHVGAKLIDRLITEAIGECHMAIREGREPVAPRVPAAVRAIWEVAAGGRGGVRGEESPRAEPRRHFSAPFSGPRPRSVWQEELL